MQRHSTDKINLRYWFRKMLKWASLTCKNPLDNMQCHIHNYYNNVQHPRPIHGSINQQQQPQLQDNNSQQQQQQDNNVNNNSQQQQDYQQIQQDNTQNSVSDIHTLLTAYIHEEQFDSIRVFLTKLEHQINVVRNNALTRRQQCATCSQYFQRIDTHNKYPEGIFGCYNIARLRTYICSKKSIPYVLPAIVPLLPTDYESHFKSLFASSNTQD
jgi:chemotaxis protein histidine kinase CheA